MKGERPYGIIGMRDLTEKIYYAYFQIGTRRIGFYKIEEKILAVPLTSSPAFRSSLIVIPFRRIIGSPHLFGFTSVI
jgi:hypothetical protein